jgi:phenylpyruvate tautomerase PptA (4-oxalocrotonate tautomerase family)
MPTYLCYTHRGQLSAQQTAQIAAGISRIHSEFTGAPITFTQCIFRDLDTNQHFIGGQLAPGNGVWVYGHIRAERTRSAKNHILLAIRDLLIQALQVPESVVWVYLNELAHTDMVEFGHVLPEQGDEQGWLDGLPSDLRDHLVALEASAGA